VRVEFVGHFLVDRFPGAQALRLARAATVGEPARVVLLPGSRKSELARHLPVMVEAARSLERHRTCLFTMVLPNEELRSAFAGVIHQPGVPINTQIGRLHDALAKADLALASSGTVTLECAWFGVPSVVLYKVNPLEFALARRIVKVPYIAMPNLLAGEAIFPEFVQDHATASQLVSAGLPFLDDETLRRNTLHKLDRVLATLGEPGSCRRAARAVLSLLGWPAAPRS
jgi:lipid-A-disaccharide synthase